MSKLMFYVPSVISQSSFIDADLNPIHIKESELNYFYLLMYLYRNAVMESTNNLLIKNNNNRYDLNESVEFNEVKIELIDFNTHGVVSNHNYKKLEIFIKKMSTLKLQINILNKNKSIGTPIMNMIDSYSIDKSKILTIKFTKEFYELFIHTKNYFMEVDLYKVFKFSSYKTKRLYLILKDYTDSKNGKAITADEMTKIIGKMPQLNIFEAILDDINTTDINILCQITGKKLKKYTFTIAPKVKKSKKASPVTTKQQPLKEDNEALMQEVSKRLEKVKSKGTKIDDEEAYKHTIYQSLQEKTKPSESKIFIDEWIETQKNKLYDEDLMKTPMKNQIPTLMIYIRSLTKDILHIDHEYRITNNYKFFTSNANETAEQLKNNEYECTIHLNNKPEKQSSEDSFKKMYFYTDEVLKQKGFI